jgi:DNA polymerase III epsilon subunit-like protein
LASAGDKSAPGSASAAEDRPVRPLLFVDTETTGLDPFRHAIWELGALRVGPEGEIAELNFHLQLSEAARAGANRKSLAIGGFKERYEARHAVSPAVALGELNELAAGAVLLGLNISFDVCFIGAAMAPLGITPSWYYSPVDVKSMLAGALGVQPDLSSDTLARLAGVDPGDFERHRALDDCYYTRALYQRAVSLGSAAGRNEERSE